MHPAMQQTSPSAPKNQITLKQFVSFMRITIGRFILFEKAVSLAVRTTLETQVGRLCPQV